MSAIVTVRDCLRGSDSDTQQILSEAGQVIRDGKLVAFPTETVYGLGADATNATAVQSIYIAKGRPSNNPLIVHVTDVEMARTCASGGVLPVEAEKLAARFWPGPLTVVVPRNQALIPACVSAGLPSVAIRVPSHPIARRLIEASKRPIAAPSANRSGFTSPTSAAHVMAELSGAGPAGLVSILDGGECDVGVESTVVDVTRNPPVVLRPGAVTAEMMSECLGVRVVPLHSAPKPTPEDAPRPSPGMLDSHYAPRTPAFRFSEAQWSDVLTWCASWSDSSTSSSSSSSEHRICQPAEDTIKALKPTHPHLSISLITYSPHMYLPPPHETTLMPSEARDYAHKLYACLRDVDEGGKPLILVLMPDHSDGLWAAIVDRLGRATKPLFL
ncbi:threonylcarbamoyl-AMP synthase [Pelomyxa schiedti]|nr:threonylcarbamoyl-AMP synthase [Pelomyxa schiedti]